MKHICTSNWNVLELIALLWCLNIVLKSVFQWCAGDINTSHITVKHSYLLISICSNNHGYIPEWLYSSHLVWTVVSSRKDNTQVVFSTVPRQGVVCCCNAYSLYQVPSTLNISWNSFTRFFGNVANSQTDQQRWKHNLRHSVEVINVSLMSHRRSYRVAYLRSFRYDCTLE